MIRTIRAHQILSSKSLHFFFLRACTFIVNICKTYFRNYQGYLKILMQTFSTHSVRTNRQHEFYKPNFTLILLLRLYLLLSRHTRLKTHLTTLHIFHGMTV